jgi:predicted acylesterase/phospholipase RssA
MVETLKVLKDANRYHSKLSNKMPVYFFTDAIADGQHLPPVDEQEVYNYYTQELLPALFSSLPILFARIARDTAAFLYHVTTRFIQFLFPLWFRKWTLDAASESGEFFSQLANMKKANFTFVDHLLQRIGFDADEHITRRDLSINAEEMKREVEALIHQYYDALMNQQHSSWYEWFRTKITNIMTVDWSLGAYLWQTCSGLIIVLIITSIVPGRLHGWTGRLLRWPILGMVYMLISVELVMYTAIRLTIRMAESVFASAKHRKWRKNMAMATSYEEWYSFAKKLDRSQGRDTWQSNVNDDTAYKYSWPFVQQLMKDLKNEREGGNVINALAVLQQCTRKNVGGIMSEDMFSYTYCGEPKELVSEFIEEVTKTLEWVTEKVRVQSPIPTDAEHPNLKHKKLEIDMKLKSKTVEEHEKMQSLLGWATLNFLGFPHHNEKDCKEKEYEKFAHSDHTNDEELEKNIILREKIKTFLKRARASYGRTALCLSGGAMMGNYHFGSVKALLEVGLLPHIISGTSAGSVIGAMICTRTDEELMEDLKPEVLAHHMTIFQSSWGDRLKRWWRHGTMFDQDDWLRRVKFFTNGDMTFEEAYKKTGRVLCVTLSATTKKAPPVLINHITAPNVTIASACIASASVPGFVDPMRLQMKDENGVVRVQSMTDETYRDGSIDSDIPTSGLSEMLNVRFFLTAQANPHIVPFVYNSKGDVGRPSRWSSGMRDDSWRGGFLLSALEMYLKNDMRSKFHFLNDVDVAVGFTSTMMTQATYSGTTTIVPDTCLKDYFLVRSIYRSISLFRVCQSTHKM